MMALDGRATFQFAATAETLTSSQPVINKPESIISNMIIWCFKLFLMHCNSFTAATGAAADIATIAATNRHGQPKDTEPARRRTKRTKNEQRLPTGSLAYGIQYAGVELDYNLRVIAQW